MVKIYSHTAGNTLGSHNKLLQKLKDKGAKIVDKPDKSDIIVVFCPIVSRYETDITSALSSIPDSPHGNVVLVAMHHTFDPNYTLPNHRDMGTRAVRLFVDCLFFEKSGLLKCSHNKNAIKEICKELKLNNNCCIK